MTAHFSGLVTGTSIKSGRVNIQYWCIDGKYRIYVARIRNGGKTSFIANLSIRFVPSHINSIFTVNEPILYLSCNKSCKKMSFNVIIKKKDNANPIDTSIVVPVRDMA